MNRILMFHILAALLALTASLSAHAQSCIDPFTAPAANPLRLPQDGLLSPHETWKIAKVLKGEKSVHERWTEAANIYLDARVRMFPAEHRDNLRRLLNAFRPKFARVYEVEATSKKMVYPESYENTPLPTVIMVHEWEHLIRGFARSGGRDAHAGGFNYTFNPVMMFKEEGAAIWAEWELARFMTPKESNDLIKLANGMSKEKKFINFVETIASNRELNRRDYLAAVRDSGRYSVGNVIQKTATSATLWSLPPAYLGGMCALVYSLFH